jgi:quinol monooxygenase YgiN
MPRARRSAQRAAAADGVARFCELQADRAAVDAHLAPPHVNAFAAVAEKMIVDRRVATWQHAEP